jgi:hypothetical protein
VAQWIKMSVSAEADDFALHFFSYKKKSFTILFLGLCGKPSDGSETVWEKPNRPKF